MKNFFTSEKRRIYWFKTKKLSVELPKRKNIYILCSISVAWRHRCEPAVWLPVPDPRIPPLAGPCTPRSCWDRTWPVSSGCTYRMCTQGTTFNFSFVLSHVWLLSFSFLFVLCFLSRSVSSGRGYNLPICACTFTYVCFSLFESDFQTRPSAEFNRKRAVIPHRANPACMPDQEERVRQTLKKLRLSSLEKKIFEK